MKFSSLSAWLGWLEQSHPKEIDLGLDRIRLVASRLDLLSPKAKVITVAGTNGKGSCVTATAGLLRAANFSVGTYTSPHLLHYAERIQINGKPVEEEIICAAFEEIFSAAAEISLTYFEYGTLAALVIFKQQNVDFMVLEVGLGGRLDAVNIIDADVAVITSIAIDHQEWLGDNREVIGREKAGILRKQQLFVCADTHPPQTILDIAEALNTKSYFIGRDFSFHQQASVWEWQGKNAQEKVVSLPGMRAPHLPLPSLAAAIQVLQLFNIELSAQRIEATLLNIHLAGRFQKVVYKGREFILDVAHNPAATEYLSKRLKADPVTGRTFAIVAMMSDKDRVASLANLTPLVDQWLLLDLKNVPRAATIAALTQDLLSLDAEVSCYGAINLLIETATSESQSQDRILVFGSFFTVAAALDYLQAESHDSRGIL
ncbi:MAG: bifunctional tetrahydrofolate synthase/dihydrofolate synthase [Gammaproteobacteria bacterium]|nr:MAG: bifunctional tetrahydrofolate synthase/dihydrofolate synthase [Gammaproteobacteria bacterium]